MVVLLTLAVSAVSAAPGHEVLRRMGPLQNGTNSTATVLFADGVVDNHNQTWACVRG
jgi:hypothetical protein